MPHALLTLPSHVGLVQTVVRGVVVGHSKVLLTTFLDVVVLWSHGPVPQALVELSVVFGERAQVLVALSKVLVGILSREALLWSNSGYFMMPPPRDFGGLG